MTHRKLLSDDKKRFKIFNDPEDVGTWSKKEEINPDLKKMMSKWWNN